MAGTIALVIAIFNIGVGIGAPLTVWLYARHRRRKFKETVKREHNITID